MPLYGCLDPSRFTLLIAGGENAVGREESLRSWSGLLKTQRIAATGPEASSAFGDLFGTGQTFLLVRPDGYLGFVGDSWPALLEWLGRWLPASTPNAVL